MKTLYLFSILCASLFYSQNNSSHFLKGSYLSVEPSYRSYHKGSITGLGVGAELSKDMNKWLGLGVNVSYWQNTGKSSEFKDGLGNIVKFEERISEFKVSPFVQLIPVNTEWIDIYAQGGLFGGTLNQIHYVEHYIGEGGSTEIKDDGHENSNFGFEYGVGVRFQFNRMFISPNFMRTQNFTDDEDGFNSLNLKIGFTL